MRKFYWCILLSLLEVSVTVVKVWKPVWIVIVNVIKCVCIIEYVSILFLYVLFILFVAFYQLYVEIHSTLNYQLLCGFFHMVTLSALRQNTV